MSRAPVIILSFSPQATTWYYLLSRTAMVAFCFGEHHNVCSITCREGSSVGNAKQADSSIFPDAVTILLTRDVLNSS